MKTYVRTQENWVVEVIGPAFDGDGNYIDIDVRYHPDFVASLIDVTSHYPIPGLWWRYDGASFTPPA